MRTEAQNEPQGGTHVRQSKYYYLKLKENYFDDDSIVLLESMQDGVLYSNILLKLYLKSLKHGGRLQLDENIPYTAQMIATITRQQIGTVERALQIFLKLGLVEVLDSGTLLHEQYRTADRPVLHRGPSENGRRGSKQGSFRAPGQTADICPTFVHQR